MCDFILPMRNWNKLKPSGSVTLPSGFYLTYEELKLFIFLLYKTVILDFILPMRNWNGFIDGGCTGERLRFYLTYEELKLLYITKAEMIYFRFYLTYEELKLGWKCTLNWVGNDFILPMRNWNHYCGAWRRGAWKILSYLWGIETNKFNDIIDNYNARFYLTYEELKPEQAEYEYPRGGTDFILPMRNWNSFSNLFST